VEISKKCLKNIVQIEAMDENIWVLIKVIRKISKVHEWFRAMDDLS
jgi:hypothetical protein